MNALDTGGFAGDGSGVGTLTRGSLSCEEMSESRAAEKEFDLQGGVWRIVMIVGDDGRGDSDAPHESRQKIWWRSTLTLAPYSDMRHTQTNRRVIARDQRPFMPPERKPGLKTRQTRKEITPLKAAVRSKRARNTIPKDERNAIFKQVTDPQLDEFKISIQDAELYYLPDLIDLETSKQWYTDLASLSTWYRPTLKVYGKSVVQSREIAAYAPDHEFEHKYSGTTVDIHTDYPSVLTSIQAIVEAKLGVQFNHVMLNKYDSGDVYIGLHADSLENRVIATVSLGAERTFIMRHRTLKGGNGLQRWKLGNGSVFVMQGDTQRFWKHEIPKEPKIKDGRISLTFRQLVY